MKKLIRLLITLFLTLFLVSCGEQVVDTTATAESTAVTASTTIITAELTTATDATEATTVSEIIAIGDQSSLREIEFSGFTEYGKSEYYSPEYPYISAYKRTDVLTHYGAYPLRNFRVITITGYKETLPNAVSGGVGRLMGIYCADVSNYGSDDKTSINLRLIGSPENPYYGYFRYDIGDRYLAYYTMTGYKIIGKIEKKDGTNWLYCDFYSDISTMKCAEKISDEYENLLYKPDIDSDIVTYMETNSIKNPTLDYKCDLGKFIDELVSAKFVDTKNFTPVGEYLSILDAFPFESFAEYSEDMRLDDEHPYLPKDIVDVGTYIPKAEDNRPVVVTVIGYKGEEIGDDGMFYSYYYVYATQDQPNGRFLDDTVYVMQAYGTPSHPYYGHRRIEIGDKFFRLETDNNYRLTGYMPATQMFFVTNEMSLHGTSPSIQERVYIYYIDAQYGIDLSYLEDFNKTNNRDVYEQGRDDDVISYMNENGISAPKYGVSIYSGGINSIINIYPYLNFPYLEK